MNNHLFPLIVVKFQGGVISLNHIDIPDKSIEITLVGDVPEIICDRVSIWLKEKTLLTLDLKTNNLSNLMNLFK